MEGYDVVVIGAGNGGLTAAAALAQKGLKVVMLERHNVPGGCATSFCRGRFEFEVALHQLSGMGTPQRPGPLRSMLNSLGVLDRLQFVEMKKLYRVTLPGVIDITLPADREGVIQELKRHFPKESAGIDGYFDLLYRFFTEVIGAFYMGDPDVSPQKYPLYFEYALSDTQSVLDKFLADPVLKAVISVYWTYTGLPPRLLSFSDMAAMLYAYIEFKPYHLKGGSQALSNALADAFISRGGEVRFNCAAEKILVKDGRVSGVLTEHGDTIPARYVVSNASKVLTYTGLLEHGDLPEGTLADLGAKEVGLSAFTVYMGLDCEPAEAGIHHTTNFICTGSDMDRSFASMRNLDPSNDSMLLTCYDVDDPEFSPPGACQVALVTLKYGDQWLQVPPAQYFKEKVRCAETMISIAEKIFPGLRNHVEEMEIATPLTHMRYLGHPNGAIYGFENRLKNSRIFNPPTSPVEGLYMAGAWVAQGGFQPTLESGFAAARSIIKDMRNRQGGAL